jgi:hypothetical protein
MQKSGATALGCEVYMTMNKKDDDHLIGSMMELFDAEGSRTGSVK